MSDYIIEAVYNLYPNIIRTVGALPSIKCYDQNGDPVMIDLVDIEQEAEVLESQDIAREEAIESIRASALRKLVENAGLTVEEVKSFINIEE